MAIGGMGGALMGGIMGGASSALGTAASGVGQLIAQAHARRQQNRAQAWMYHMDSTLYQRRVRDLRAAGINPILAATFGGSSPTSGIAGGSPGVTAQPANIMASARAGALLSEELKRIRQERYTSMSQESKNWADAYRAQGERLYIDATTARELSRLPYEREMGKFWESVGGVTPYIRGASSAAQVGANVGRAAAGALWRRGMKTRFGKKRFGKPWR